MIGTVASTLVILLALSPLEALGWEDDSQKWWLSSSTSQSVCCECVPFYACYNNTIVREKLNDRSDTGLINVASCPNLVEFCCLTENKPECKSFPLGRMPLPVNKDPRPTVHCECALWETCPLGQVVTDGKGAVSHDLYEIGLVTHSKCSNHLEVCCEPDKYSEDRNNGDGGMHTIMESRMNECHCVPPARCSEINLNGNGLLEPRNRFGHIFEDKNCLIKDEVCCKIDNVISTSQSRDPTSGIKRCHGNIFLFMSTFSLTIMKAFGFTFSSNKN